VTRRVPLIAAIATVAVAVAPAVAGATASLKSGTYKGSLAAPRTEYIVILHVSHGKLTSGHLSNFPIYCSGGGPPIPVSFPAAEVSKTGKFTTNSDYKIKVGPLKGKIGDRFVLSGTFSSHGTVSGKLKTVNLDSPTCGGSSRFSAQLG
jgi:hypothetical protein